MKQTSLFFVYSATEWPTWVVPRHPIPCCGAQRELYATAFEDVRLCFPSASLRSTKWGEKHTVRTVYDATGEVTGYLFESGSLYILASRLEIHGIERLQKGSPREGDTV